MDFRKLCPKRKTTEFYFIISLCKRVRNAIFRKRTFIFVLQEKSIAPINNDKIALEK